MINIRPMTSEDITIFKKWLYTPHVAKWYHEPLDWITVSCYNEVVIPLPKVI